MCKTEKLTIEELDAAVRQQQTQNAITRAMVTALSNVLLKARQQEELFDEELAKLLGKDFEIRRVADGLVVRFLIPNPAKPF